MLKKCWPFCENNQWQPRRKTYYSANILTFSGVLSVFHVFLSKSARIRVTCFCTSLSRNARLHIPERPEVPVMPASGTVSKSGIQNIIHDPLQISTIKECEGNEGKTTGDSIEDQRKHEENSRFIDSVCFVNVVFDRCQERHMLRSWVEQRSSKPLQHISNWHK